MAAILRVKRKNTDTPLDTLVIACKRSKTEASLSDAPTVQTIAQFAGTLTDPTEDVTKHVAKILPKINTENHKSGIKRVSDNDYPANITGKVPKWIDVDTMAERYKVTDCQHSLDTSNEEEFKNKWMTLIDVEDRWSISHLTNQAEEDIEDYVYDLYYAQTYDDVWFESDNILVQRMKHSYKDEEEEDMDDSSDSNAESHWRNDYPDTDPDRSSDDNDSDDNFDIYDDDVDIYNDDDDLYDSRREKRRELKSDSDSDASVENNFSDNEERLSEVRSEDDEETSDNEQMENI